MKIAVFFIRAIALMMEAARTSETLVNFYQTTRCYNPEDSNLRRQASFLHGLLSIMIEPKKKKKKYVNCFPCHQLGAYQVQTALALFILLQTTIFLFKIQSL
jgi:hypothetical protein